MNEITKTYSDGYQDQYEINQSLGIAHYKFTEEIVLVNFDTGEEFLIGEDYEEAQKVCEFILSLVKEAENESA